VAVTKEKLPRSAKARFTLVHRQHRQHRIRRRWAFGGDIVVRPTTGRSATAPDSSGESDGELTAEAFFPDFRAARELSALVAKS